MSLAAPIEQPASLGPTVTPGERVRGILTRPRETFARMTEPDAWFWPAVFYLVGYTLYYFGMGVRTGWYQAAMLGQMMRQQPTPPTPSAAMANNLMTSVMPSAQAFWMVLSVPLLVALTWSVRTALFYGLARLLGGARVHWGRAAAMVGWAWLPLLLQYAALGLVTLASAQVFAFVAAVPEDAGMAAAAETLRNRWLGQFVIYFSPLALWNLWLCWVGVAEVFQLPRWKAFVVILIPTILQLLFFWLMYWFSINMLEAFGAFPGLNGPAGNAPRP